MQQNDFGVFKLKVYLFDYILMQSKIEGCAWR
jgi:hypothetical protein